ncbi:MAG TPA: S24/S26 family peptidase [Ornithinimicrobium sp.]|uniref:S24/S26 family peptidase n=1 Tax=Ornithinimicrobium sp. TaxID=1977084 RepID=UPI002B49EC73|nr:S24/S26 family peptidase [Ornithinimicrobium sp.]HKJ13136.1 S24/S26 family peptidase [Ornithinimicrobium sp.]
MLNARPAPAWPRLGLVRVHGLSMEPTARPGQLLLVRYGTAARPGDLVVVDLPPDRSGRARPPALKRLTRREGQGMLWVESDNPGAPGAVDSWSLGALPASALRARVLAWLTPPQRIRRG